LLAEGDADVVDCPAGVGDEQEFGGNVEAGDCLPAGVLYLLERYNKSMCVVDIPDYCIAR
jgi:hypothetical protein